MEEVLFMNEYKPPFHMTIPDKPNSRNQRYRRKQLDR